MRESTRFTSVFLLLAATPLACAVQSSEPQPGPDEQFVGSGDRVKGEPGKADSSVEAVIVDFEFDAELDVTSSWNPESKIEDQLLYTIGQLNGERGVGRLDQLQLSNIETTSHDGVTTIKYHARLPVAWGHKTSVPKSFTLKLPRLITSAGQQAFTDEYKHDCVDFGAHDVDTGSMWYYYRPARSGCDLDPADVVEASASVTLSTVNTTGKYPEYHKVWEDGALNVVAVFGKYEDGASGASDAGISAYNRFLGAVRSELGASELTTTPASIPANPGVSAPDVTFSATLPDGKRVVVTALLVDNVRTAGSDFNRRYEALSTRADLITYNGHAGLGANIRALAQKGQWTAGQYAIAFLNGCDTYAYVDSALADAHASVNPGDLTGTRHLDVVVNAMPSFFSSMSNATMALVRGLLSYDEPKTYEQIFKSIDSSEVVIVSGEQDNEFFPGYPGDGEPADEAWAGMSQSGSVRADEEHRFQTPKLRAGSYRFQITGSSDADLYVRVGEAPSIRVYDCRPFKTGSSETCSVELSAPAEVHVMVRGWDPSSEYALSGEQL